MDNKTKKSGYFNGDALIRIRESYNNYTETDVRLADYIQKNPKEAVEYSAKELGDKSGTSAAAVMRFIKKLGYEGFLPFKLELDKSITANKVNKVDHIIHKDDTLPDIIDKLCDKIGNIVKRGAALIKADKLGEIVRSIVKADCLYLYGLGASALVAADFQEKMFKINRKCVFHRDSHVQLSTAINSSPNDAAIILSYSGATKEMHAVQKRLKQNNTYIAAVCGNMSSPLAKTLDNVIQLPDIESESGKFRLGAVESRYAMFYIMDIIFMSIAKSSYDDLDYLIKENKRVIEGIF